MTNEPKFEVVKIIGVGVAAFAVATIGWYFREQNKVPAYPLVEIAFGSVLSVQGVLINTSNERVDALASVLAFVAGVRIIIDGLTRFGAALERRRAEALRSETSGLE